MPSVIPGPKIFRGTPGHCPRPVPAAKKQQVLVQVDLAGGRGGIISTPPIVPGKFGNPGVALVEGLRMAEADISKARRR